MTYTAIESAVLNALGDVAARSGVRDLRPYNGEIAPNNIDVVAFRMPAVLVHVQGLTSEPANRRDIRTYTIILHIIDVAIRNMQGNPGVYNLTDQVRQALNRKYIANAGELILRREEMIAVADGVAIMRAYYDLHVQASVGSS
jgi:hypothetical protein